MSQKQVSQSARSSRIAKRVRENALRTGVQTVADPVAAYARAWRLGKVASFEIPAEYRVAATS